MSESGTPPSEGKHSAESDEPEPPKGLFACCAPIIGKLMSPRGNASPEGEEEEEDVEPKELPDLVEDQNIKDEESEWETASESESDEEEEYHEPHKPSNCCDCYTCSLASGIFLLCMAGVSTVLYTTGLLAIPLSAAGVNVAGCMGSTVPTATPCF